MIEDFLIDLEHIQLEDMEIDLNMDIDIDFEIDVDLDGLDLTLLQELEAWMLANVGWGFIFAPYFASFRTGQLKTPRINYKPLESKLGAFVRS